MLFNNQPTANLAVSCHKYAGMAWHGMFLFPRNIYWLTAFIFNKTNGSAFFIFALLTHK